MLSLLRYKALLEIRCGLEVFCNFANGIQRAKIGKEKALKQDLKPIL